MMFQAILIPVFVQVALTFGLLFWMGALRGGDVRRGAVNLDKVGLREPGWPTRTTQVAYAFSNQFEVPVLFYVLVAFLMIMRHADVIFVALPIPSRRRRSRRTSGPISARARRCSSATAFPFISRRSFRRRTLT